MKINDMAFLAIERAFFYEDYCRLQSVKKTLDSWHKKGYLNALALIANHPRFFPTIAGNVEKYGNVVELHQSHDGIFTIVYSGGHEDYLLADGRNAFKKLAA